MVSHDGLATHQHVLNVTLSCHISPPPPPPLSQQAEECRPWDWPWDVIAICLLSCLMGRLNYRCCPSGWPWKLIWFCPVKRRSNGGCQPPHRFGCVSVVLNRLDLHASGSCATIPERLLGKGDQASHNVDDNGDEGTRRLSWDASISRRSVCCSFCRRAKIIWAISLRRAFRST